MKFSEYNGSMHLVDVSDDVTCVIIPCDFKGLRVSTVCSLEGSDVEEVILPDSVEELPIRMFCGCTNLRKVVLPKTLVKIPDECFRGCVSLVKVEIGSELKEIGQSAFRDCSKLKEFDFTGIEKIGGASFYSSGLEKVELIEVKEVAPEAFSWCSDLESAKVLGEISSIQPMTFNNCGVLKSIELAESIRRIGMLAFGRCIELIDVNVPTELVSINENAFTSCIKLSDEVKERFHDRNNETAFMSFDFGGRRK